MPARRDPRTGGWFFRKTLKTPDGKKRSLFGTPGVPGPYQELAPTKVGAEEAEARAILQALAEVPAAAALAPTPARQEEVLTFEEWFHGRFWTEWVIAQKNKPSEVLSKRSIYRVHLGPAFGRMPLNAIDFPTIARFRAKLIESGLSDKRINNILAALSKALNYAAQAKVIASAPSVGMLKVERPEIVAWSLEEYARLLATAKALDPMWYAACCLAGEAGLRVGEIRALDWKRDVDLVGGTLTVNRQSGHGHTTTPKGRTRRTVPMTETLLAALKGLDTIRTGFVIRNLDGTAMRDNQTKYHCYRLCRAAGLPERGWHNMRHAFGTHAAMFGVNPWKLMLWMGHKRIDETMLYVHFAEAHMRPLPDSILAIGRGHDDPDRRIIAMLSARQNVLVNDLRCSQIAAEDRPPREIAGLSIT
jgi:integrase